jgi:hypothetical protein
MKRMWTLFEIAITAVLLLAGLYMLEEGTSNKSTSAAAILLGGSVCFTVGVMNSIAALRSMLWHRSMQRRTRHQNYMGGARHRS